MIVVCDNHVSDGVKMFNIPHVKKADGGTKCLFCQQKATIEIYYFDLSHSMQPWKQARKRLAANA
ncbi:hypothetical protein [Bacillus piscicola]|uniref:hypothetical protein n=1 Tax=Bacillus piscicola TaxID=1632684 RepID=UPI001F091AAF|nr:hypothetical protein [Bacillus piscicola]